ncbi:CACNA1B [Symbiodinium sp. CCMP2592]|nr:CACNA1B [Symbiodinium sp. CCMP2592]
MQSVRGVWLREHTEALQASDFYARQLSKDSKDSLVEAPALSTGIATSTLAIPAQPPASSRPKDALEPANLLLASDIEQPNQSTGFLALRLPEIVSPSRLARQISATSATSEHKSASAMSLSQMSPKSLQSLQVIAEELEIGGLPGGINPMRTSTLSSSLLTFSSMSVTGSCCRALLRQFVNSTPFELFFGFLIFTNSVLIGATIQWQSLNRTVDMPEPLHVVSTIYNALFVLELSLRLIGLGCKEFFCTSSNVRFNWFDFVIVVSIMPEFVMPFFGMDASRWASSGSNLRILRILRLTRLIRVVRVLRIVRFFRSLQTLIHSILSTLRDLFWAMLLLVMLIYMFAVLFTEVANQALSEPGSTSREEEQMELLRLFGDLRQTIHTLFMSIAGGLSWVEATNALETIGWTWVYVFTCYVAFCLFAVLNVMTGVFCNSAIKGAEKDQEMATQALMVDKHHLKAGLTKLFAEMDRNCDGTVSYKEFKHCLEDERVKTLFEALELGAGDAKQLFKILDVNKDDSVGIDEFLEGCTQVRGNARAIDLFTLSTQTNKLRKQMGEICTLQRHLMVKMEQISMKIWSRSFSQ